LLGPFEKISPRSFFEGREVVIAAILSVVWIILLIGYGAGYFGLLGDLAEPRDAAFLEVVFFLIVLVLPISMVWLGSGLMRRSFQVQDEARRLERQLKNVGETGLGNKGISQPRIKDNRIETLQQRVSELTNQLKLMETTLTSVQQMQAAMQAAQNDAPAIQSDFGFDTNEAEQVEAELSWPNLVRALDFPKDEKDSAGFTALRLAKRDEDAGQVLRAAEDILNLLAQEGIYMDDLRPENASPEQWRLFAAGKRGDEIAAVGGIHAPEAMERIEARNRSDQIFRDTTLYFLRRFDIMLRALIENISDPEIQMLADTRTGRAFMLLGRSAGMFG